LQQMMAKNPALKELVEILDLEPIKVKRLEVSQPQKRMKIR